MKDIKKCKMLYKFLLLCILVTKSVQIQYATGGFGSCLKLEKAQILDCAKRQALEALQLFTDAKNFTLAEGLVVARDQDIMGRSAPVNFLDSDPNDFRSLLENAGAVMSERNLQWSMERLYPGLQLKIGPSISGGLLEFVMDPHSQYDERIQHSAHDESTARAVTRKFVLPFLLGLKFNLVTLLPIILGAIILISKKAAFLSKLALFISGLFGLGSVAGIGSLAGGYGGFGGYGFGGLPSYGYGDSVHHHDHGVYKVLESNTPRTHEELGDNFYEFDKKHLFKDRASRLYEREVDQKYKPSNQKSFVWATTNQN